MIVTNSHSGTNVSEVAERIYRISTPGPGLTFNQYLIADDQPLLYHTGPRGIFPLVREAVASLMAVEKLRYVSFSHVEADESGSLNQWLAVAPEAVPVCGRIGAMVSVGDLADRPPHVLGDGETLKLGTHSVQWFDTPHLPHAWDCGHLMELHTSTLLCGDLFTQGGDGLPALTESDILGPSEALRKEIDYFSHSIHAVEMLERLAMAEPQVLACMHGSAWRGDGAILLRELADVLAK